jgi:hypothetical protein
MRERTALFSRYSPGGVYDYHDLSVSPAQIWFVDSGSGTDGAAYGDHPDRPYATLDYAVGSCTSGAGDVIYVMPGHAETIIADSGVDIDVAGVKVIGLGWGAARPTFTFTTAVTADFKLAAAGVYIENLLFLNGLDSTTGIIEVSGADCIIKDCEVREAASGTAQATNYIVTTTGGVRLLVDGLRLNQGGADAGPAIGINLVAAHDTEIRNSYFYGNFSTGCISIETAAARIWIHDCTFWTENSADIAIVDTATGSTGWIGPNLQIKLADNAANITTAVTGATFQLVDPVYVVNLVAEKAMLINWTPSVDET